MIERKLKSECCVVMSYIKYNERDDIYKHTRSWKNAYSYIFENGQECRKANQKAWKVFFWLNKREKEWKVCNIEIYKNSW